MSTRTKAGPKPDPEPVTNAPPQTAGVGFASMVGQEPIVGAIRSAITRGRLPHALLFSGPPGVGKATCAGILAQAVNCMEEPPDDACGRCVPCRKITRGCHPDVMWVAPTPSSIGIERVRDIVRDLGFRPYEGRHRVVLIDDAHTMTAEAQNAFLKTLEEPPGAAIMILVTSTPLSLLPTVRSRCQSLGFSPLPQPAVVEYLEQVRGLALAEARLRASLAVGSIGGALSIDLEAYATLLEAVVESLRLAQAGGAGVIQAAEILMALGSGRTGTQKAVSTLYVARDVLRDLLVVAAGAGTDTLVNTERLEAWRTWASELSTDDVVAALGALSAGIDRLTGPIQPNTKLALEKTLFEVGGALAGTGAASVSAP